MTTMLLVAALLFGLSPGILSAPSPQLTGEIRSYHQIGDKIKGEYSRLHPDGSVTKTWAFGDTKNGLQYKTYQMDPLGNVKTIETPQNQQAQQLNQQNQQQINQQPQNQIADQFPTPPAQTQNPGTQNISPGVNWFLQQPLMTPMTAGTDPFAVDPFPAPPNPQGPVQDPLLNPFMNNPFTPQPAQAANPLLGTNNPLWNWWNF